MGRYDGEDFAEEPRAARIATGLVAQEERDTAQPAIAAEFAGMRNDLSDLDTIIEKLSSKLSPVLHTRIPSDVALKRGMVKEDGNSPILDNIMDYRLRIQEARDALVYLMDRVQV